MLELERATVMTSKIMDLSFIIDEEGARIDAPAGSVFIIRLIKDSFMVPAEGRTTLYYILGHNIENEKGVQVQAEDEAYFNDALSKNVLARLGAFEDVSDFETTDSHKFIIEGVIPVSLEIVSKYDNLLVTEWAQ